MTELNFNSEIERQEFLSNISKKRRKEEAKLYKSVGVAMCLSFFVGLVMRALQTQVELIYVFIGLFTPFIIPLYFMVKAGILENKESNVEAIRIVDFEYEKIAKEDLAIVKDLLEKMKSIDVKNDETFDYFDTSIAKMSRYGPFLDSLKTNLKSYINSIKHPVENKPAKGETIPKGPTIESIEKEIKYIETKCLV